MNARDRRRFAGDKCAALLDDLALLNELSSASSLYGRLSSAPPW